MKHTLTFLLLLLLNATTLRAYSRFTSDGLTYQTLSETEVAVTGFTRESQSIVIPSEVEHDGILYAVSEIGQWAFSGCSAQVFSLPESLRSIGKSAFTGSGLIAIELPAAVTFLGEEAFSDCRSLTAVTLSSGITEIGERTFSGCTSLTTVTLPDRISIIGEEAFLECTALSSLQFPQSLTSIRSRAFKGCQSLASVALSGNVKAIESEAFSGCTALRSVAVQEGLRTIGEETFSGCLSLTGIALPGSVSAIGSGAFRQCEALSAIALQEGLTSIGADAFRDCTTLASVQLPTSVTTVGTGAFAGCTALTSASLSEKLNIVDEGTFAGCLQLKEIRLPENVIAIGNSAFYGCEALTAVTLSESLMTIGDEAFRNCRSLPSVAIPAKVSAIGTDVFQGCDRLERFEVAEGNPAFAADEGVLLNHSRTTLLRYPPAKTGDAYTVPAGVTSLGRNAFSNSRLPEISLSGNLTAIGWGAFANCGQLKAIALPMSVRTIEDWAFDGCEALAELTNRNPQPQPVRTNVFSGIPDNAVLKVPEEAVEAYRNAEGWRRFRNIEPLTDYVEITYRSNNGLDFSHVSQFYPGNEGQTAAPADLFAYAGYQLTEWNTEAQGNGRGYAPGEPFAANEFSADVTLYAQWEELTSVGVLTTETAIHAEEGRIYNPRHEYFTLYDINGRTVYHGNGDALRFPQGIYLLRTSTAVRKVAL